MSCFEKREIEAEGFVPDILAQISFPLTLAFPRFFSLKLPGETNTQEKNTWQDDVKNSIT